MPAEYLLLESGDHLLLESGDDLLLESSTVDQSIALPLTDDSSLFGPNLSTAGVIDLPLIDDSDTLPPVVFEDKTIDLPLVDDAALFGPSVSGAIDLPLIDDAALFGPTVTVEQTADLPLIDDSTIYAPSFLQAQTLDLRFIDGGWPFGPTVTGQVLAGLAVYVGTTQLEPVTTPTFRDPIDDLGSFSVTLANDDADLALLAFDAIVRFEVDGEPVFSGVVRDRLINHLAPGEEVDHVTTVSGPGYLGIGVRDVVYPSRGVGSLPIEEVRSFAWPSVDFDVSAWPFAKNVNRQREYATWRAAIPWIWPDMGAWWIAPNRSDFTHVSAPTGANLYRKSFTLAEDATMRFYLAGDNSIVLYLDGAEMAVSRSFTQAQEIEDIELSAGTHVIGVRGNNYPKATLPNPTGIIVAGYTVGDAGLLDELIVHTDTSWRAIHIGSDVPPGFTPGDVLYELREETDLFDDTWFDFTRTLASDGQPWDEFAEITVKVGRTHVEVLREMAASIIDVAAAPGAPVIQAWNKGDRGVDLSGDVTLTQTPGDPDASEFLKLSHTGTWARANRVLIRYADGDTEVSTGAADRGAYLEVGHIANEAEAQRYGREIMADRSTAAYSTSARLLPSDSGPQPYRDFGVGDWVMCLNEDDDLEAMRVMAITLDPDEVGVLEWGIELRAIELELEELHQNALRRAADGQTIGGARVSSPAGKPNPSTHQVASVEVAEFSTHTQDAALPVGKGIARRATRSGNAIEISATITLDSDETPTTTATTCRIWWSSQGGAWQVLGGLVTVPAGETLAELSLSLEPIRANVDRMRPEIVSAGSGAEGIDIKVLAI